MVATRRARASASGGGTRAAGAAASVRTTPRKRVNPKDSSEVSVSRTPTSTRKRSTKAGANPSQREESVEWVSSEDEGPREPTGLTSGEDTDDDGDDDASEDEFKDESDDEPLDDESVSQYDSDDLDASPPKRGAKRKSNGAANPRARKAAKAAEEEEYSDIEEIELEEGQEIVGRIYNAPKTGWVPAGQISVNTLEFLKQLLDPKKNDRDWFKSHDPWFRKCEQEFKEFVMEAQDKLSEADDEIPVLPPRDVIHRIYRDVRFSSDKTPYKPHFSFSTSRGGRKGNWAHYNINIQPNGGSWVACGMYCPEKDQLQRFRNRILEDPAPFRAAISAPAFVKLFGQPKARKDGRPQNVFGHYDELKVAPKGIDKTHKDIDLLRLRSVVVLHRFSDEEVLAQDFKDKLKEVVTVIAPFTHLLNDMIT